MALLNEVGALPELPMTVEQEIALEFVQPVYSQDGKPGVGFFDTEHRQLFVIPTKDELEARTLTAQFVCLFVSAMYRFKHREGSQ